MGCGASKDLSAAKKPKKMSKAVHEALKHVCYPFADGILLRDRHKQVKSGGTGDAPGEAPQVLSKDIPKTLGEILEEKEGRLGSPEPEVINVWELMEGLEDQADDEQHAADLARATTPVAAVSAESLESRVGECDHASVTTDHEEFESSPLSSPDLTARHTALGKSPPSPRSPLCFDSPHKKSRRRSSGSSAAAGVESLDVVVTRNFSFNLRSCMDQASTPKVLLDSNSPMLRRGGGGEVQKKKRGGKEVGVDEGVDCGAEFDAELLSTFETMLEQLSSDSWLARTSCVEGGRVDVQRSSDVTLRFKSDDQECVSVAASIVQGHGVLVKKKDVSADPAWIMDRYVEVPALFIDGRYVGSAEEVLELKERDQLRTLLDGGSVGRVCNGCCGACWVPCLDCNGSRRFFSEDGELEQCNGCSESGTVRCPLCSSC